MWTFAGAAPFEGFMAKYLADNRDLSWSEFLLSMFDEGSASAMSREIRWSATSHRGGYRVEIGIPAVGQTSVRLSLSVLDVSGGRRNVFALARRNYPANPATYAEIRSGR